MGIYDALLTSGKRSGYKFPPQNLKRLLVIHHVTHDLFATLQTRQQNITLLVTIYFDGPF